MVPEASEDPARNRVAEITSHSILVGLIRGKVKKAQAVQQSSGGDSRNGFCAHYRPNLERDAGADVTFCAMTSLRQMRSMGRGRVRGMSCLVRRATKEDAAGLARVQVESWRTTYRGIVPEAFLAEMKEATQAQRWRAQWAEVAAHIFVATDENDAEVCGFACGGKIRLPVERFDAEMYAIYLLKDRQGAGVGRRLLCRLADSLKAAGFERLLVWVLEANPAVGFYERMGARRVAKKTIDIGGEDLPEVALGWEAMPGEAGT